MQQLYLEYQEIEMKCFGQFREPKPGKERKTECKQIMGMLKKAATYSAFVPCRLLFVARILWKTFFGFLQDANDGSRIWPC